MTLFPEILPWVQAGLTQQQVAVKTRAHLQRRLVVLPVGGGGFAGKV